MRPRNERRNRVLELGVLLLIKELFTLYDVIPPVTLVTIVSQILLYGGMIDVPLDCISAYKVWEQKKWKSFFLSTFQHADDMHLYYNMVSFLVKGRSLEYRYGSANFAILLAILSVMTSGLYVALAIAGARVLMNNSIMHSCAIGFSGVIFALKMINTLENPVGQRTVAGFRVPTRFAAWAELIAIHVLVPNTSFLGHFAGILAGFIYMKTFIGTIIDNSISALTGHPMVHYRRVSQSSYSDSRSQRSSNYFSQNSFSNIFQRFYTDL